MSGGIAISYSGVHQAFQLALAAHELGALDGFYCSLFDGPGKWGRVFSKLLGADALRSRRVSGLPPEKVYEYPWPVLWHEIHKRLKPAGTDDWAATNGQFDKWVAGKLADSRSRVLVAVETCGEFAMAAAGRLKLTRVLECPGMDAEFLDDLACKSADEFGLVTSRSADSEAMRKRKERERQMADAFIFCSETQRRSLGEKIPAEKPSLISPLWIDTDLWKPAVQNDKHETMRGPLKVLFAGKIGLRKGIPYLLRAKQKCGSSITLTLVGTLESEVEAIIAKVDGVDLLAPRSKSALRELYWQHDVLVLPSLGDSFGFVALEAMACGLPVIVTENCGVPVPDPAWRVPIMDSGAIAERLEYYAGDRAVLEQDGRIAAAFARQFTPQRYRDQIKCLFRRLLEPSSK